MQVPLMNINIHSDKIEIRHADHSDYPSIHSLLLSMGLPTEGVRGNLQNFMVLVKNDRIIGTVGLEIYGENALLRSLGVDDAHQGLGYGTLLYQAILQKAIGQNIQNLYLLTETAENFFTTLGFKKIARDTADHEIKLSTEFVKVCPKSATCMMLSLTK